MRKNSFTLLCTVLMIALTAVNVTTNLDPEQKNLYGPVVVEETPIDNSQGKFISLTTDEYVVPTYTFEELFDGVFAGSGSLLPENYQYYGFSADSKTALRVKCDEIIASVTSEKMSTIEKIKAIHDYLVLNIHYDMTYTQHDALDTLTNGIAVCSGYSSAFQVLMERMGIECKTISGMNHAWNAVKLDGAWYYVDVTWDDPLLNGISSDYPDGRNLRYDYFLVPYSMISVDHEFDSLLKPEGTTTKYYEWAYTQSSQQKKESFMDLLRSKGYREIVFVDVDPDTMKVALIKLAENGHDRDGCVVAYYKNVQNPQYSLPVFSVNGQKYVARIQEWAQDYYYIMLTLDDIPEVEPGIDNDDSDNKKTDDKENGETNDYENDSDNDNNSGDKTDDNEDSEDKEDKGDESDHTDEGGDDKKDENEDNTGGNDDGDKKSDDDKISEDDKEQDGDDKWDEDHLSCDPQDDPSNTGNASVGGGSNIYLEGDPNDKPIEAQMPMDSRNVADTVIITDWEGDWDCSNEVVNGEFEMPF